MVLRSVLTGDIVNSTKLSTAKEKKMLAIFNKVLIEYKFEFYRGDSFQVFVKNPLEALKVALLCRTGAISISKSDKITLSDVRISIGLGDVKLPVRSLSTAKGEAFILSGRAFDDLSVNNTRLSISVTNKLAQTALQITSDYLNAIFKMMTGKQAEVVFELLKGQTQQEVAVLLKRSKSTIHQHVTAGRWNEIDKLLKQYENIINQIS